MIGFDRERCGKARKRFCVALHPVQNQAVIGVRARRPWVHAQRRRHELERFGVPTLLRSQHAKQMQGFEMLGLRPQYLQIEASGRRQVATAVRADGALQPLWDGRLLFARRIGHLLLSGVFETAG